MPITIPIHPVEPNGLDVGHSKSTAWEMVEKSRQVAIHKLEFLNSSFGRDPVAPATPSRGGQLVKPTPNGLVDAAILAFNNHHHLSIRPDDIWICIVTQLSFYINAHAEKMRSRFVAHEGQKELISVQLGDRFSADWPAFIVDFNKQIKENLVDEDMHRWLIPAFTTTTETDVIAAGACIMGAMKKYFSYEARTRCGLPSITIEGVKEDWVNIREKVKFLATLERTELTRWHNMLIPIIDHFIAAFDGQIDVPNFWDRMIKYEGRESGGPYIDGWMTSLIPFSPEGRWLLGFAAGEQLEVAFLRLETSLIAIANVEVELVVDDNGLILPGRLVAGLMGYEWNEERKQISPAVGWALYIHDLEQAEQAAKREVGAQRGARMWQPKRRIGNT